MKKRRQQIEAELKGLGSLVGDTKTLASRFADDAWLAGAVRTLEPAGRCGLRLLCVGPLSEAELNTLALRISGDHTSTATDQLVGTGLVCRTKDRLGVLGSLQSRLHALAAEVDALEPAAPSALNETFIEQRFSFALGAALCAVKSMSPRATRLGQLHKTDARPLCDSLAPVAGGATQAQAFVEELIRAGLLRVDDLRVLVADDVLPNAAARLFLHRLEVVTRDPRIAAGLNVLLENTWVRARDVDEAIVAESIRCGLGNEDLFEVSLGRLRRLATNGGVLSVEVDGVEWWRLSAAARRALDGGMWEAPDVSPSLLVLPHLQIVASLNTPVDVFVRLGAFCRFDDADHVARLSIESDNAKAAARHSIRASDALDFLEQNAVHGIPHTVARALSDWMKVDAEAQLLVGAVLLTDAPQEDVKRLAGAVDCTLIAPGVWLLPASDASSMVESLRAAGWGVTTRSANTAPSSEWSVPERSLGAQAESICEAARVAGLKPATLTDP